MSTHRRLPPLNIMHSLALCRKSRPTCTLSLAHVSACNPHNSMQVELDLSTIHFVAVSPTRSTTTTTPNDVNVIPFPTSTQTTPSSSPSTTLSHTTNSFKRQQVQKKEATPVSSSVSPPRKRARKGSLSNSPPSSSRSSTPSPRVRALAQRVPPARPPTPTPDSRPGSVDDDMDVGDKSPTLQETKDLEKHGQPELPPYSPSPPPYSPPVVAPMPISSPTPIPLHVPIPVVPLSSSSSPTSSSIPATPTTPPPRPLPVSSPPPPPPSSSSTPAPPPQRKSRITPSELRFFIFLYRTVVSGLEIRQQTRLNTQQVCRTRDGSRREQHLDGVLVEVDDDDVDVDPKPDAVDTATLTNEPSPSLKEDLEAQDALLALRLRGFLKWNGVEERMLKVDSSSSPTNSTGVNPFLEDDSQSDSDKMDVDAQSLPIVSSRHLITVLRMRGTCGPRQGGPIGLKFKKNNSKLRTCAYEAEGDD